MWLPTEADWVPGVQKHFKSIQVYSTLIFARIRDVSRWHWSALCTYLGRQQPHGWKQGSQPEWSVTGICCPVPCGVPILTITFSMKQKNNSQPALNSSPSTVPVHQDTLRPTAFTPTKIAVPCLMKGKDPSPWQASSPWVLIGFLVWANALPLYVQWHSCYPSWHPQLISVWYPRLGPVSPPHIID